MSLIIELMILRADEGLSIWMSRPLDRISLYISMLQITVIDTLPSHVSSEKSAMIRCVLCIGFVIRYIHASFDVIFKTTSSS